MKKTISVIIFLCFLFTVYAFAENNITEKLTAETWISASGSRLEFKNGGKGSFVGKDMTYETSGNSVTFTYAYWGDKTTSITLYMVEDEDYLCMATTPDADLRHSVWFQESRYEEIRDAANRNMEPYDASFGEEIDLGILKFTLDEVKTTGEIRGSGSGGFVIIPDESGQPFVFSGTVENTGKAEVNLNNIKASLVVGDETIDSQILIYADADGTLQNKIAPMGKGTLYIARNLTDAQRSKLNGATLTLSMAEDLSSAPSFLGYGDIILRWTVDGEKAEGASSQQLAMTYFEESPALAEPTSFFSCSQSGKNVSSSQNKLTRIRYSFKGFAGESGAEMASMYCDALKEAGYTVKKSGGNYTVSYSGKTLAEFTGEGDRMTINVTVGNEKFTSHP